MSHGLHISQTAAELGVTLGYLRLLEKQQRVLPVCRDLNGRIYSEFDIELLRTMGVRAEARLAEGGGRGIGRRR